MFSQVIQSFSSGLNTVFPSYILLKVPLRASYKLHFAGYTLQDYTSLIKKRDRGIKYKTLSS